MSSSAVERALQPSSLTLTVKVEGKPAVHLVYDQGRPVEQTAVTVLDQATSAPWTFEDVVWQALIFLVSYYAVREDWPAELRAPCRGRTQTEEAPRGPRATQHTA